MLYCLQNVVKARSREDNFCLCIRQLHLNAGEYVAITGPSGCGKSTSLDILGMTLKPDNAEALLFSPGARGYDLKALWFENNFDAMAMLRRQHVGYVLQTGDLLPFFNVFENIMLTARLAGIAENDAREHVGMLMEHLQISPLAKAMPTTLSVGERQRVAICRALASKPSLILADEPTAALDPVLSRSVMRLFLAIVQETNATVAMVSHDIALVKEFSFREVPVLIGHESDSVLAVLDDSGSK